MSDADARPQGEFFRAVLDSMAEQIAVIESGGRIRYVNRPWLEFCVSNDGPIEIDWSQVNYARVCEHAAAAGDDYGRNALEGIRRLEEGVNDHYSLEYPCHSPTEERWFMAQMTRVELGDRFNIVISHHNITDRKRAEQRAHELARTDPVTGIANRQHLDEFLQREWQRATRARRELSVLLLDVDAFKSYNDHYGHQAGDECLREIAQAVHATHRRGSELVARYGGEEFIVVLGESDAAQAETSAQRILDAVRQLALEHTQSEVAATVTVSIGVATVVPRKGTDESTIVSLADEALYEAKGAGRDRYRIAPESAAASRS